jgi:hypothetical protein
VTLGPRPPKRHWDERALFALMFSGLFVLARWFPFYRNPYTCTFKQLGGYPCFTCGMTRAWVLQIHGRLVDGLVQSPGGSLLCWLAMGFTIWTIVRLAARLPSLKFDLHPWTTRTIWIVSVTAFFANWLYSIISGVA